MLNKWRQMYSNGKDIENWLSRNTKKYHQRHTAEETMSSLGAKHALAISTKHAQLQIEHKNMLDSGVDMIPEVHYPHLTFGDLEEAYSSSLSHLIQQDSQSRGVCGQLVTQAALGFIDNSHYHHAGFQFPKNLATFQPGHLGVCNSALILAHTHSHTQLHSSSCI